MAYNKQGKYWKKKFFRYRKTTRRNNAKFVKAAQTAVGARGTPQSQAFWGADWDNASAQQKDLRRGVNFRGKGDYKSVLRWGTRALGGLAGGAAGYVSGGYAGLAEGAKAGWNTGAGVSKYFGWGDYSGNQLMQGDGPNQQISVNRTDNSGDIYLEHTEFVGNVMATASGAGNSTFQVLKYVINPGMDQTFPFMSQVAQNYVLYEFQGLIFQYKPNSGESGAASNSLGKIIMATNYDPTEPAFVNAIQMENEDYANSTKPSCGMLHGVETHPQQSMMSLKYIRTGSVTRDLSFYDVGNFYVATEGIPFSAAGTQILGELWVTYKIRLSRANLYGALLGLSIDQDCIAGTCAVGALISTTTLTKSSNQIGCTVTNVSATAGLLSFPPNITLGTYMVTIIYQDSGSFGGVQVPTSATLPQNLQFFKPGTSVLTAADGSTTNQRIPGTGVAANNMMQYTTWITIQAPGTAVASFQFNVSAALTATSNWKVVVTQFNQNVSLSVS